MRETQRVTVSDLNRAHHAYLAADRTGTARTEYLRLADAADESTWQTYIRYR